VPILVSITHNCLFLKSVWQAFCHFTCNSHVLFPHLFPIKLNYICWRYKNFRTVFTCYLLVSAVNFLLSNYYCIICTQCLITVAHTDCIKHLLCLYLNINQLDALNFIMSSFHDSTCFEHNAHRREAKIVLYSLWYHHTYITPIGVMIPEAV
jgi:hypothetical protein